MNIFLYVAAAFIIFIIVWDIILISRKGKYYSISANIIRYFKKYPVASFFLGLVLGGLAGHLTWSMSDFDWMPEEQIIRKCKNYCEVK